MKQRLSIRIAAPRSPALAAALELRRQVFVVEQGVPHELERDELDALAVHVVAEQGAELVATLRIVSLGARAKIGRVAVRRGARALGVGRELMTWAIDWARRAGFGSIQVDSQLVVAGFYQRLGFVAEGPVFEEAGIAHQRMCRTL